MEINPYNDLKISSSTTDPKSTAGFNSNSSSLFNKLISQVIDTNEEENKESSSPVLASFSQDLAELNERAKNAINNIKENVISSSNKSNTHDELTLMLQLKNIQAS